MCPLCAVSGRGLFFLDEWAEAASILKRVSVPTERRTHSLGAAQRAAKLVAWYDSQLR